MARLGLYLGGRCPPNMEAYVDARLYESDLDGADLVVLADCSLPGWILDEERLSIRRYDIKTGRGVGMILSAVRATRRYVRDWSPDVVRQITQPRWHAPGVVLGAAGTDTRVHTRASASMLTEFRSDDATVRSFFANNVFGRAVYLGDTLYTPKYGALDVPWWSSARRIVETRALNLDRFSPGTAPFPDLFSTDNRRVLTVGRVSRQKGMDLVLSVSTRLPEWEFAVVGPTQDRTLTVALRNRSNVCLHDPVDYTDMPGAYAAADALLSASRLEWGGISRAMIEAKVMGLPVVALNQEDASEVADVTVPESPDDIASGLQAVLDAD